MVRLKKISITQLPALVAIAYMGDNDLLEKYHIKKYDFFEAVASTMLMINETSKIHQLKCHKIIYESKPIGYMVSYGNVLYSFGINISLRKKSILVAWWSELKKEIGKEFVCRIFRNNTRCIEFLKKQQMQEIEVNEEHNFVTLLNTK